MYVVCVCVFIDDVCACFFTDQLMFERNEKAVLLQSTETQHKQLSNFQNKRDEGTCVYGVVLLLTQA